MTPFICCFLKYKDIAEVDTCHIEGYNEGYVRDYKLFCRKKLNKQAYIGGLAYDLYSR
ncbi:hypothetical protein YWY31_44360 [Paenibacillus illinoisensis]